MKVQKNGTAQNDACFTVPGLLLVSGGTLLEEESRAELGKRSLLSRNTEEQLAGAVASQTSPSRTTRGSLLRGSLCMMLAAAVSNSSCQGSMQSIVCLKLSKNEH